MLEVTARGRLSTNTHDSMMNKDISSTIWMLYDLVMLILDLVTNVADGATHREATRLQIRKDLHEYPVVKDSPIKQTQTRIVSGRNWGHPKRRRNSYELVMAAMKSGSSHWCQSLYTFIRIYFIICIMILIDDRIYMGGWVGVCPAHDFLHSVRCSQDQDNRYNCKNSHNFSATKDISSLFFVLWSRTWTAVFSKSFTHLKAQLSFAKKKTTQKFMGWFFVQQHLKTARLIPWVERWRLATLGGVHCSHDWRERNFSSPAQDGYDQEVCHEACDSHDALEDTLDPEVHGQDGAGVFLRGHGTRGRRRRGVGEICKVTSFVEHNERWVTIGLTVGHRQVHLDEFFLVLVAHESIGGVELDWSNSARRKELFLAAPLYWAFL